MPIRILHIIDDAKFIDYCKSTYEINNYANTYAAFFDVNLKSIRQNFDVVVVHFLKKEYAPLFDNQVFPTDKIVWTLWGADCFSLGKFFNTHLLPKTRWARLKTSFRSSFIFGLKILIKSALPVWFDRQAQNKQLIELISKIKNVVVLMPNDANELKANYDSNATFFHINYVDPLLAKGNVSFDYNQGDNILIGNSSAFTNNHIDVLSEMRRLDLQNFSLLLPLNYGDKIYGDIVEEYANKTFQKKAVSLRNFLSFEAYVSLLETCEIAVMPHVRQQAIGNIVKLLLQGTHIYFYSKSSIFQFLMETDFVVSTLESTKGIRKLTSSEKEKNQRLALAIFGSQNIHAKVEVMINQLLTLPSEQ